MRLLFDLLPVVLFFVAYKVSGIYAATAVAIVASVLQIAWLKLRRRRVDNMQWVSLGIIVVFGGMTLYLQNPIFVKWKPTVLYGLFAVALAVARIAMGRNLIRSMMGKQVTLPEPVWERLNLAWIVFFVLMAVLNIVVAYGFSEEIWVNFKLFGTLGLTLLFVVAQAIYFSRHIQDEPAQDERA